MSAPCRSDEEEEEGMLRTRIVHAGLVVLPVIGAFIAGALSVAVAAQRGGESGTTAASGAERAPRNAAEFDEMFQAIKNEGAAPAVLQRLP